jgi:hypothetical protein
MPDKTITDIDHLLTYVRDLSAAASLFRRMGFSLSPISRIEEMGISNHLVLMRPRTPGSANFIELMASHDRSRLPPAMDRVLSGAEGIKSMVLGVPDARIAHAAMTKAGFQSPPPVHVKREWLIGPGESVFPEFDVTMPTDTPLVFNCCRYFNVGLYTREDWLEHPNGAQCLRATLAVADDPAATASQFAKLFGCSVGQVDGWLCVSPGNVDLWIGRPQDIEDTFGVAVPQPEGEARYIGYIVETASTARLAACLDQGAVPYRKAGSSIYIEPVNALGNLLVFRAEGRSQ